MKHLKQQFMRRLSNTGADLKKALQKKVCISLVPPLMIPPNSWCESGFNLFFAPSWILSCFFREWWKNKFFSSRFCGFWNCDLRTDLFHGFLKSSTVQKTICVRLLKENLICSNNAPEIHILNSWRHQVIISAQQIAR